MRANHEGYILPLVSGTVCSLYQLFMSTDMLLCNILLLRFPEVQNLAPVVMECWTREVLCHDPAGSFLCYWYGPPFLQRKEKVNNELKIIYRVVQCLEKLFSKVPSRKTIWSMPSEWTKRMVVVSQMIGSIKISLKFHCLVQNNELVNDLPWNKIDTTEPQNKNTFTYYLSIREKYVVTGSLAKKSQLFNVVMPFLQWFVLLLCLSCRA